MYGSNVESDSTMVMPEVGIIENCTLHSVSIPEGKEMLSFEFRQPNGGTVRHTEFPANPDYGDVKDQATNTSRRVKHIATKVMPEAEFIMDDVTSFMDYARKVVALFEGKGKDQEYRMLFIYRGKYVALPKFPNFIESMSVAATDTSITISAYNQTKLVRVTPDVEASPSTTPSNGVAEGDLPF